MKSVDAAVGGVRTPISVASEIAALLLAGAIAATALLPSALRDRPALLAVAAFLAIWTLAWFHVVPRRWFGRARPLLGSASNQAIAAGLLLATGGADSFYFGYYFVPVLVTVFQLNPKRTMVIGVFGLLLYWLVFFRSSAASDIALRDTALIRSVSYLAVATVSWLLTRALLRMQEQLVTERSRLSALIDALKEPILVTTGGIVSSANAAALAFFGPSSAGRKLEEVMPGGLDRGADRRGPAELVDATGRTHHVELADYTLPGGEDTRVWVAHDVSQHAEANRMREQLLYNVAHELRGPLAVLDTSLDLVQTDIESLTMAEVEDLLARARRSVGRMRSLMEDLLSAGNIQAGRFVVVLEDVALEPVIRETVDGMTPVTHERTQRVVVDVLPGLVVRADARYVQQVLHNLLANASRYGGMGSDIAVTARARSQHAHISVDDRGPGIAPGEHAGLFERFYRVRGTSDGGVGLGLAIAKGIVEAHGGTIGIDSTVGIGTSVWFTLPLATAEAV